MISTVIFFSNVLPFFFSANLKDIKSNRGNLKKKKKLSKKEWVSKRGKKKISHLELSRVFKIEKGRTRQIEWENWYYSIFIPLNDGSSPWGLSSPGRRFRTRNFPPDRFSLSNLFSFHHHSLLLEEFSDYNNLQPLHVQLFLNYSLIFGQRKSLLVFRPPPFFLYLLSLLPCLAYNIPFFPSLTVFPQINDVFQMFLLFLLPFWTLFTCSRTLIII